jgi:hypothetical protein
MLKYGKAMKDLAEDFKAIWKKDRRLLWWMAAQFAISVWLFLLPIINLNPNRPKVWARYSDISSGYAQSDWWYLVSFAIIAIVLGIGHNLLSAKLYSKRGGDIARLFLGVSIMITIIGIRFLISLIGEG